ncbi:hypothetical protein TrVE_jg12210 [Triparma verrucosa]|uniref:Transmembrane protein n=2 Tax=Triparma TaxID=722752 RepID=A0A9W7EJ41_9STRA|nr:hypothetical protein TrST_g10649 [Triparma strigata]GMH89326.1 hypothetical protein TrVE_jg12210 [Triparma verrucosa]
MISCRGYARKLIFATLLASFFSPTNASALPGQPDLHVSAAARGDVETFPSEGNSTAPIQPHPSGVMYPKTSALLATVDLGWSSLLEAARKVHSEPTEAVEEVLAAVAIVVVVALLTHFFLDAVKQKFKPRLPRSRSKRAYRAELAKLSRMSERWQRNLKVR